MIIFLRRMATVTTFRGLRKELRREPNELCMVFNFMVDWMIDNHGWLIEGDLRRWGTELTNWSRAVESRTGPYDHDHYGYIVMFIDGTCRRISRPTSGRSAFYDLQRLFWSGYKKYHNINFSVIVAPNGLVIDICGPVPGRHSDKWVQSWSNTETRLRQLLGRTGYVVYGDSIYSTTDVIRTGKRGLNLTPQDIREKSRMNGSRTCVENNFAEVENTFQIVSFKRNMKILSSKCGVGNLYKAATLLNNFRTCMRGSQSGGGMFGIISPELQDYVNGLTHTDHRQIPNINTM